MTVQQHVDAIHNQNFFYALRLFYSFCVQKVNAAFSNEFTITKYTLTCVEIILTLGSIISSLNKYI